MAGTGVGKFSSTAGSNTANMTVNFAENMAPSNVNNAARELMGHMRDMYEQLGDGYFEFGDGDGTYTVARGDADTITITSASDISSVYFPGRKIRITDGGANVVEGTIASSTHASTTQTVNLTGISLAAGTPTKVELGIDTAAFGGRVILDDNGDTYIEAPTDDTIDIYVAGAKDFVITANTFTAESGSTIAAQALTATTVVGSSAAQFATAGIGAAKDLGVGLHIKTADSGQGTAHASADELVIEGSGNSGINILSANNGEGGIYFGDDGDNDIGRIRYDHSNNSLDFFTNTAERMSLASNGGLTIITGDNLDTLTLTSTDADANQGPALNFKRDSSSPADNDFLGKIVYTFNNDAPEIETALAQYVIARDVSNGSEDIEYKIEMMTAGAVVNRFGLAPTETIFNEDSADVDFRVESNGNANMLHVNGGNNLVGIGGDPDLGAGLHIKIADSGATATTHGDELVIEDGTSGANVGISILCNANGEGRINFGDSDDNDIGMIVYEHDGDRMEFSVNNSEVMRMTSTGHVAITSAGTSSGGDIVDYSFYVSNAQSSNANGIYYKNTGGSPDSTNQMMIICQDASANRFLVNSQGDCQNHDNSYGAISDERIKQDIRDSNSQWNDIKAIKVRNFKKKDDVRQYGDDAWEQIGVVAQELEAVCPKLIRKNNPSSSDILSSSEFGTLYTSDDAETQDAVLYTSSDQEVIDGDKNVGDIKTPSTKQIGGVKTITEQVKSVNYSVLYMKAIKALQEAMTRIETLETKVAALEG